MTAAAITSSDGGLEDVPGIAALSHRTSLGAFLSREEFSARHDLVPMRMEIRAAT